MPALSRRRAAHLISAVKQSARSLGTAPLWYWGRRGPCRPPVQQTTRSDNCRFPDGRYYDMIADVPDDETIALRVTLQQGALAVPRREIPIPGGSIGWIFGGTVVLRSPK
jgi:hypothetical protein